jgi:transketolase
MDAFETAVRSIQFLSADAVEKANSGHPGTPMALAGIATEVFTRHLRHDPSDPAWPNRDRFVLSCGHASMLLYSVLHLAGYAVPKDELQQFRQLDSLTPGHPEFGHTQGVETTTGPLGQGISNAVGLALASKMAGARVNAPGDALIDYRVFVIASDGDLMEGVASEAASLAGHWRLENLVVVYDANNITIDGKTDVSFTEDVGKRFEAYGWSVKQADGHDPKSVRSALDAATQGPDRPTLIIAKTRIGIGAPTKEGTSSAHGAPLGAAEIRGAKEAAGWPVEPAFTVPELAYSLFKERAAAGKAERSAWSKRVAALTGERKAQYEQLTGANKVPADILSQLVAASDRKTDATRSSGSRIEQRAAALVPTLIGGSADLSSSTRTDIAGSPHVRAGEFAGRNLHFGVREHAMGAIANGLALGGFIPLVSTFLIFSDYMRPPIRLAAMMGLPAIFVFTHDSFYVGEDGPTHQPIEQLSALRLIPDVDVLRPADSLECAGAWAHALLRTKGPTVIALSRQNLPALERPASFTPEQMLTGAYIVSDAAAPDLVLIATGSEVSLAVAAKPLLEKAGHQVRVVSVLSLEAFSRQPVAAQQAVLGKGIRRVSIEAGRTTLWRAVVGLDGIAIGIDHYGASAPAEQLAEKFGFTPELVAKKVLASL